MPMCWWLRLQMMERTALAHGTRARRRLRDQTLAAPELLDLEVSSVLWRLVLRGLLTTARA